MNRAARRARGRRGISAPTLGLSLIAKDEADTLPTLLDSIAGAFDQIVLVDTGSTDGTVAVFEEWCRRTGQRHTVDTFDWCDDFAAARNYARRLLDTDWDCWADCDDTIHGALQLRKLIAHAPPDVTAFAFDYMLGDHASDRLRVIRHGKWLWAGRVHEITVIRTDAVIHRIARDVAHWSHGEKGPAKILASLVRNRQIVEMWVEDEPDSPSLFEACRTNPILVMDDDDFLDLLAGLAERAAREAAKPA